MWIWDALGYMVISFLLGSFVFWVFGYFILEAVRYYYSGPSQQLRSVGTSILNSPEPKKSGLKPPILIHPRKDITT